MAYIASGHITKYIREWNIFSSLSNFIYSLFTSVIFVCLSLLSEVSMVMCVDVVSNPPTDRTILMWLPEPSGRQSGDLGEKLPLNFAYETFLFMPVRFFCMP
jgi:hypothetical protein